MNSIVNANKKVFVAKMVVFTYLFIYLFILERFVVMEFFLRIVIIDIVVYFPLRNN